MDTGIYKYCNKRGIFRRNRAVKNRMMALPFFALSVFHFFPPCQNEYNRLTFRKNYMYRVAFFSQSYVLCQKNVKRYPVKGFENPTLYFDG